MWSRCRVLCIAAVFMLSTLPWQSARAQFGLGLGGVVYDPRNFAQNVLLYRRAYEQLTAAKQQLQAQVTALQKLASPNWRDLTTTIAQTDALMRQANTLGYGVASLPTDLQRLFTGRAIVGDATAQLTAQTDRTLATLRTVLTATSRAAQAAPTGLARLQAMKRQLTTVRGHQGALELGATVNAYAAEELTLLRQQLATQINAEAVYYTHQVNQRAQAQASERALWAWFAQPVARGRTISYRPR